MPLPQANSDIFERRRGGGWFVLFGIPFFLAGIIIIAVAFIPREIRGGDEFPLYVAIPFGGIFALVGGGFIFGRSGTIIDKSDGTIRQWWGAIKPMRVKEFQIRDIEHVSLRKEIRRTDKSTYTVFPVRLRGRGDTEIKLSEEQQMQKARQDAENLAKFLLLPIHDETGSELRIREPDTLDDSLRDRFRDGLESNEIPDTPTVLKSQIEYDGTSLRVLTKPIGMTPKIIIMIVALGLFELFSFGIAGRFLFDDSSGIPAFVAVIVLFVFAGIPALIIAGILGHAFMARDEIRVDSTSLTVTRRFLKSKTKSIPVEELEELFIDEKHGATQRSFKLGNTSVVRARSDSEEITFGLGLPPEELDYIYALTKAAIVS